LFLVNAAALAMCPTVLTALQRFVGDVDQAAQIIALDRVLFACHDFGFTLARIHEAGNTLERLLVGSPSTRMAAVIGHVLVLRSSLMTHVDS
jgi:hypothetical protein